MVAVVPSHESQLYLKDPVLIIAYTWRKFSRTPADAVPILPDLIISLPQLISLYSDHADTLSNEIQTSFQKCLSRIFGSDRTVIVSVTYEPTSSNLSTYDITVSITYTTNSGELDQIGTTVSLVNGQLNLSTDSLNPAWALT